MRSNAHLPSLAGLHLGAAPTGTGMETRAARRRRVEGPPALPPPPLRLTGLPRDVINVMVTQAALDARNAEEPAQAICEWMGQFCKAAKVQGVAGCEDRWYMLALQTFGVPPDSTLPGNLTYDWRELFAGACYATTDTAFIPEYYTYIRTGCFKWNASQRELDEAFVAIFNHLTRVKMSREGWGSPSSPVPNQPRADARASVKARWNSWLTNAQDPLRKYPPKPEYALALLLLLKGAEPWVDETGKYKALDNELYNAMIDFMHAGDTALNETLDRMRDALDRGATLTYSSQWVKQQPFDNQADFPVDEERVKNPMQYAMMTKNADIINLLLDRGWKFGVRPDFVAEYLFNQVLNRTTSWRSYNPYDGDWRVDEATSKRLIQATRPYVNYLRKTPDKAGPVARAQRILDNAREDSEEFGVEAMSPYKDEWFALLLRPSDSLEEYRAERNAETLEMNAVHGDPDGWLPYP